MRVFGYCFLKQRPLKVNRNIQGLRLSVEQSWICFQATGCVIGQISGSADLPELDAGATTQGQGIQNGREPDDLAQVSPLFWFCFLNFSTPGFCGIAEFQVAGSTVATWKVLNDSGSAWAG